MLKLIKNLLFKFNNKKTAKDILGFSMIEAMVATAVIGIGFVGVFSLTSFSEISMHKSTYREKLQLTANSIIEVMQYDIAQHIASNIASNLPDDTAAYIGANYGVVGNVLDLSQNPCVTLAGTSTIAPIRAKEWCNRMNAELGLANGDTRSVFTYSYTDPITTNTYTIVHIQLEALNKSAAQVVVERVIH